MEEFNLHNQNTNDDDLLHTVHFGPEESEGREGKERKDTKENFIEADMEERGAGVVGACAEGYRKSSDFEDISERRRIEEGGNCIFEDSVHLIENEEFKYIGGVKNDLREGFGVCYYKNGEIYKGLWRNDRRNGLGIMIYPDNQIIRGEVVDNIFSGFCEVIHPVKKISMEGHYYDHHFTDYIVVKNDSKIFEGEVIKDFSTNTSLGKVTSLKNNKKSRKFFLGEVLNYKEENGFGIYVSAHISNQNTSNKDSNTNTIQSSTMYIGHAKKKCFENYLEMYNSDGASYFCFLKNGQKHGFCFSFSKDGKVSFGEYRNNFKHGAFLSFSNCHNLPKSSVRMELFYYDFKSKAVDKMETSKKYLLQNYPEFKYIFNINYSTIISKLNDIITEELAFFNQINPPIESIQGIAHENTNTN